MEKFNTVLQYAIDNMASDIHMIEDKSPVYRINKNLIAVEEIEPMNKYDLESLMEFLVNDNLDLVELFETTKRLDIAYEYDKIRFRINASMASGVPAFSIRVIRNMEIDPEKFNITEIVNCIKRFQSGLILITGKVNSGKTTTLNAYVQNINRNWNKKIVMLEEPIEYTHKSRKSIVVQKEVGRSGDIPTYYDGVINLLREDADIAIVGEIRDRQTMDAAFDLAESGTLVIGTLHTRSCGETLDRILGMYLPAEQKSIKYVLSSVLKTTISQKLIKDAQDNILLVPEIMVINNTIGALIRQDSFSVSEIQDAINLRNNNGTISFERSFARIFNEGKITLENIKDAVDDDMYVNIVKLVGGEK